MTPRAALVDFETLLAPIDREAPAGGPVPYELKDQLEQCRKEDNPSDYADDDPMRPEQFRKADWPKIIALARDILTTTSKDLLTAARLTEALTQVHAFAGLRDGLRLLRLLIEQCWDRLNPPLESEDDLDMRAGPFHWLDDPDRGARFPNTVRNVALVDGAAGALSWVDWRRSQDGNGAVTREDFEKAIRQTRAERCLSAAENLAQSSAELAQLVQLLGAKMGPAAPALTGLRQAIDDCRTLLQQILKIQNPEPSAAAAATPAAASLSEPGTEINGSPRPVATRAEAYRQLAQAADLLQQLEPHSPIPYFVKRAVELGNLPFPQLIRALIREPNVLLELERELGIKGEAPGSAEEGS